MPEIRDGWVHFPESPEKQPVTLAEFTDEALRLSDAAPEAYDPANDPAFRDQWLAYLDAQLKIYGSRSPQLRTTYEYIESSVEQDGYRRDSGVFPVQSWDPEAIDEFITKLKSQFG